METVKKLKELQVNIDLLETYMNSKIDPEYSFALTLIKRGTCFAAVKEKSTYKFYPSRFIGYINNNMDFHLNNESRDGRETNLAISIILGSRPQQNLGIDKHYRQYCESLGFHANERGTFGVERKYWVL